MSQIIIVSKMHSNEVIQFFYEQVKHDYSLPRAHAVICGRLNITVNRYYLHAQNQGKLARVCLQRFSSIFETIIYLIMAR